MAWLPDGATGLLIDGRWCASGTELVVSERRDWIFGSRRPVHERHRPERRLSDGAARDRERRRLA